MRRRGFVGVWTRIQPPPPRSPLAVRVDGVWGLDLHIHTCLRLLVHRRIHHAATRDSRGRHRSRARAHDHTPSRRAPCGSRAAHLHPRPLVVALSRLPLASSRHHRDASPHLPSPPSRLPPHSPAPPPLTTPPPYPPPSPPRLSRHPLPAARVHSLSLPPSHRTTPPPLLAPLPLPHLATLPDRACSHHRSRPIPPPPRPPSPHLLPLPAAHSASLHLPWSSPALPGSAAAGQSAALLDSAAPGLVGCSHRLTPPLTLSQSLSYL